MQPRKIFWDLARKKNIATRGLLSSHTSRLMEDSCQGSICSRICTRRRVLFVCYYWTCSRSYRPKWCLAFQLGSEEEKTYFRTSDKDGKKRFAPSGASSSLQSAFQLHSLRSHLFAALLYAGIFLWIDHLMVDEFLVGLQWHIFRERCAAVILGNVWIVWPTSAS